MIHRAAEEGEALTAAELAVLVTERGLGGDGTDLAHRLSRFRSERGPRADEARGLATRWAKLAGSKDSSRSEDAGGHLARAYPDHQLHLIMDNYAAHKHPKVKVWLTANPRIGVHFTPTSGSWLNLVEVWFSIIERQAIHRGAFPSVRDLMIKIRAFINGWNDRCQPFVWTKTADQILTKANRKTTSVAVH